MNVSERLGELQTALREEWRRSAGLRVLAALVWMAGVATLTGFQVNVTRSLPLGLYFWDRSAVLERGTIVLACLPEQWARFARERDILGFGYCPGWTRPIGKMVLALGGDTVEVGNDGITVNGVAMPNSRVRSTDRGGRPLPRYPLGIHVLADDEVWLHSVHHPDSFDSRYYGPVPRASIRALARGMWTDQISGIHRSNGTGAR